MPPRSAKRNPITDLPPDSIALDTPPTSLSETTLETHSDLPEAIAHLTTRFSTPNAPDIVILGG